MWFKDYIDNVYVINILIALLSGYELSSLIGVMMNKNKVYLQRILMIQSLFSIVIIFGLFLFILLFFTKLKKFFLKRNMFMIQLGLVVIGGGIEMLSQLIVLRGDRIVSKVCFVIFMIQCFYIIWQGIQNYRLYEDFYCHAITIFVFLQIISITQLLLYEGVATSTLIFTHVVKVLSYIFLSIASIICLVWKKKSLNNIIDSKLEDQLKLNSFKNIVNYSERSVVITDENYKVIYVNESVKECLKNKTIIGKNLWTFVGQYKTNVDFQLIEDGLSNGKKWSGQVTVFSDGNKCFLKCEVIRMIKDHSSESEHVVIIENITDNKILYDKLQRSENRVVDVTNNMVDFLVKVDRDFTMEFISTSYCNALGYSYKELRGAPVFRFIHEDDRAKVYDHTRRCLETNVFSHIEYRMRVRGGQYIWVESIGNFKLDNNGKVDSAVITSRDISKRKYYEKALVESEEKYRELFNMVPNYIYVVSLSDDSIEEVNNSMKETFIGEKAKNNELLTLESILGIENAQIHYRYFYEILRGEENVEFELNVKNINNEDALLQININPIYCEQRIVKILCMARDITDKRKIEELQIINETDRKRLLDAMEYDRIKTEFFANISHELRTPINVILAAIQLDELEEKKNISGEKKYKNRNILKQNCFRLLRLINNLIDLTKIDSGYFELNLINCDMVNVIENVVQSIVPYARNKNITMVFDTNVEEKVMAVDLDKIERIVLNLISNAIKFTPSEGEIYVSLIDQDSYIEIHIKDTGRGIPGEQLNYIFERFRQIDKSLSRDHEGSGIGLYLVKNLVELHGGEVWVSSSLGRGSDFVIQLPHKFIQDEEVAATLENDLYKAPVERIKIELSDIYGI